MLCLLLVALFCFIVIRALSRALRNDDPFMRFAASGLAILFGAQSAINMAVNLHLIPAKGMTLPFISYGGSSLLSLAYGMGMLLALTRERPRAELLASNQPRREFRREQDGRRPARAGGGRRHRRTSVSRRSARGGAWPSAISRSRSRPIPAPPSSPPFRPSACMSFRARPGAGAIRFRSRAPAARSLTVLLSAFRLYGSLKPSVVVGFGGYPTVPPVMAASLREIPTLIHEQNGVMGRANRFLAGRVSAIATGFAGVTDHDPKLEGQDHLHRQSGAAGGGRGGGDAVRDAGHRTARFACWCSAAARARA